MKILSIFKKSSNGQPKPVKISSLITATGIGVFMASLDGTIVNISLVKMSEALEVQQYQIQWVIISYLLTMIAFTAVAGDLGDRYGNKLVFQIGVFVFSLGSLLCSFSKSLATLIVFRIIQGIGGSGTVANGMAIITRFTTSKNRGMAIGLNSFIIAMGITLGPVLGGVLTETFGWESIFLVNVPLGIIGLIWVQIAIPPTPPVQEEARKADVIGSITLVLFLTLLVFSISIVVDPNIPNGKMWFGICLALSVIMLLVFLFWEKRTDKPLVDLKLFNRKIATGVFAAIFAYMGLCVIIYQIPFFLQDILQLNPIQTGLVILGAPVGMAVIGAVSGKLSDKIDARYISSTSMIIVLLVQIILTVFLSQESQAWFFTILAILVGIGLGGFISPNTNSVMSAAPKEKLGVANGLLSLSTNIGFSLGTALSTLIFAFNRNIFQKIEGTTIEDPNVYVPAMKWMFLAFALITVIAIIVSYLRGPEERKEDV